MPSHETVGAVAASHGGTPMTAALERGHYEGVAAGERPGGFDWRDYRRTLLRSAGVPSERVEDAQAALRRAMAAPAKTVWCQVLTGAVDGLQRLEKAGVPVAIVSNADGTVAELLRELHLAQVGAGHGLPLGALVDSGAVGVEKPDPGIFRIALEALGVPPTEAAHLGDTVYADVDGARRAGVTPLHLDPIGWCRDGAHEHLRCVADVADLVSA
jgi:putative hydrolase of the HAD superfamily